MVALLAFKHYTFSSAHAVLVHSSWRPPEQIFRRLDHVQLQGVFLRAAERRVQHRQQHHASEEKSRQFGADTRKIWDTNWKGWWFSSTKRSVL